MFQTTYSQFFFYNILKDIPGAMSTWEASILLPVESSMQAFTTGSSRFTTGSSRFTTGSSRFTTGKVKYLLPNQLKQLSI